MSEITLSKDTINMIKEEIIGKEMGKQIELHSDLITKCVAEEFKILLDDPKFKEK